MKTLLLWIVAGCLHTTVWAQGAVTRWFDGERWVAVTAEQGVAQAAGGLVVRTDPAQLDALKRFVQQQGISHQPWSLPGALWLPAEPGAASLALSHRLQGAPVPIRVEPNWALSLRRQ
jgi:hypothetical protein